MTDTAPTTKTTNSTVKWGALFIIVLMLLSGVAVFFGSQTATQPTPNDTTPQNVEQFTGEDVQGTIVEVFSSAIVGGQTSDGDKTEIDALLQTISGVQSITSQFSPLQQDGSVTYIANLTLAEDVDRTAFAEDVLALELFDAPEIYFQASVQVESEHEVLNSKGQLTRITLPSSQIQSIVSPLTEKGDVISGTLAATFQGTKMVSAYLLETQNITASPTPLSLSGEYSIQSLTPTLSITGEVDYFPGLSAESLSGDVESIAGVSGVTVPYFPAVDNTLLVEYSDINRLASDLNTFVSTHPESFDTFTRTTSGFSVRLTNATVSEAKTLLSQKINELSASNILLSFTAPRTQFLIDANTLDASNEDVSLLVENYFDSLDANASIEVYQNGTISASAITAPDTGESYSVSSGAIDVSVSPGHDVNDIITIYINAIALRGELVYVNGVETPENGLQV